MIFFEISCVLTELQHGPAEALLTLPAPVDKKGTQWDQVLPVPATNFAGNFDEDQIAITAAIASKTQQETLVKEIESPSYFFYKQVSKAVVKQCKE